MFIIVCRHFYHEYCSTNQYHEMMRSSDFQKKQPSLTGSAGSADMKVGLFIFNFQKEWLQSEKSGEALS